MKAASRWLLAWGVIAFLLSSAAAAGAAKKDSANVLLVTLDTLRPDRLSCYGSSRLRTPNIDRLAQQGALFSRAFSHNPITLAAHVNILLGLTPPAHGVHDNSNFIVRDEFTTLAEWLKKAGYETGAVIGAFPLDSRFGLAQGFDLYDDNYGAQDPDALSFVERRAEEVVAKAVGWLEGRTGPWFLWIHLFDPHQPYDPPEPFRSRFKDDPYSGEVAYVDQALGKLLSAVEAKGPGQKTITVMTFYNELLQNEDVRRDSELLFKIAFLNAKYGTLERAEELLARAVQIKPSGRYLFNYALVLSKNNKLEEAAKNMQLALSRYSAELSEDQQRLARQALQMWQQK